MAGPITWRNVNRQTTGDTVGFMRNASQSMNAGGNNLKAAAQTYVDRLDEQRTETESNNLGLLRQSLQGMDEKQLTDPNLLKSLVKQYDGAIDTNAASQEIEGTLSTLRDNQRADTQLALDTVRTNNNTKSTQSSVNRNNYLTEMEQRTRAEQQKKGDLNEAIAKIQGIKNPDDRRAAILANQDMVIAGAQDLADGSGVLQSWNQLTQGNLQQDAERRISTPEFKAQSRQEEQIALQTLTKPTMEDGTPNENYIGDEFGPLITRANSLDDVVTQLDTQSQKLQDSTYGKYVYSAMNGATKTPTQAFQDGFKANPVRETENYRDTVEGDTGDTDEIYKDFESAVKNIEEETGEKLEPWMIEVVAASSINLVKNSAYGSEYTDQSGIEKELRKVLKEGKEVTNRANKLEDARQVAQSLKARRDYNLEGRKKSVLEQVISEYSN